MKRKHLKLRVENFAMNQVTHLVALAVCTLLPTAPVFAGYFPTKTEINLAAIPVDKYFSPNQDDLGNPLLISCPTTWTVQSCIKSFFNNNPNDPPYNPLNYIGQGVTGTRFFFTVGGGWYSTAWDQNGTVRPAWVANFAAFMTDLKSYGLQSVTPTLVYTALWSGTPIIPDPPIYDCTGRTPLLFLKWVPYGLLNPPNPTDGRRGFPDCQGNNQAYNIANANPYFWGWDPFFNLIDQVLAKVQAARLQIEEFDLENEIDLADFTVTARLIYDTQHGSGASANTDVLNGVHFYMTNHGFDAYRVTYSTSVNLPSLAGYDCGSVYGDSAMILPISELAGALAGGNGLFGEPTDINVTNNLPCGGQTKGMISLPLSYDPPTATDLHSGVCVVDPLGHCTNTDSTSTATNLYSDMWSFLVYRGLTGNLVVFGETISNQNCEGYTLLMAVQNVEGYKGGTLYANHAAGTTFRPWNNDADLGGCYVTPSSINPPYDSQHP
jgi:hypothetical protein